MKTLLAIAASAAIGLAPAIGTACDYHADHASSASAAPPAEVASAPAPEATKAAAPVVAKAVPKKAGKTAPDKAKAKEADQKVAALNRS